MNFPSVNPYPTRKMVVADPSKMTYFAQAQAARFGVQHTAGTLDGLGEVSTTPPAVQTTSSNVATEIAGAAGSFVRGLFNIQGSSADMALAEEEARRAALQRQQASDNTILGLPPAVAIIGGGVLLLLVGSAVVKAVR